MLLGYVRLVGYFMLLGYTVLMCCKVMLLGYVYGSRVFNTILYSSKVSEKK